MLYIANAFSVNMLPQANFVRVRFRRITDVEALEIRLRSAIVVNIIRHDATAQLAKKILRAFDVCELGTAKLKPDDEMLVFMPRWKGGRPPETKEYSADEIQRLCEGLDIWHIQLEA